LPRLIARYGSDIAPATPECGADLDDRSLSDFGRLYFGNTVLTRWMAPLVTSTTFGDEKETSRVLFLRRFRQEWGQRLSLPRAGLEEVAAAAALQLGTRFGVEVTRIDGRHGAPVRLTLVERGPGEGRHLTRECDAVVVATSAAEARRIARPVLEPAERDVLGRMQTTPSVALFLRLRRPFHSHCRLIRVPHDEDSPIESVLLEPGTRGGRAPEGRGLATIRATGAFGRESRELSDDVVEKALLDAFEVFQPGVRNAIESTRLRRVESAATQFGVGHFREIARLERVLDDVRRRGRKVYFAGDYLMGPTWEDALASGHRAAERVANIG
jgi:protoporphyrinogen oxidase